MTIDILHFQGFIWNIATEVFSKYNCSDFELEDLFQIGACSFLETQKKIKKKFSTGEKISFLKKRVRGEMIDQLRKNKYFIDHFDIENPIDFEEYTIEKIEIDKIYSLFPNLSNKHRQILYLYFQLQFSLSEIAEIFNCSQSNISIHKEKALRALKNIYLERSA